MVFVNTEWQFYLLRFLIGAMEAGFAPGVLFYLTLWFPVAYRGRITSTLFLASAFAGLLGAPAAGLVLSHLDGVLGMAGWHWLFLVGGLPCVVLGVLVFNVLKDRIQDAGWLTPAEQTLLSSRISDQNKDIGSHSLLDALKTPGFLQERSILTSRDGLFRALHLTRLATSHDHRFVTPCLPVRRHCVVVGKLSDATGAAQVCRGPDHAGSARLLRSRLLRQEHLAAGGRVGRHGAGVIASIRLSGPCRRNRHRRRSRRRHYHLHAKLGGIVSGDGGSDQRRHGQHHAGPVCHGCQSLVCAAILLHGLPATLRRKEERIAPAPFSQRRGRLAR
jgi:hypothetical protein